MNQAKKLLFYLGLNIIVSLVTVTTVLYIWDKTQLKNVLLEAGESNPAPSESIPESQEGDTSQNQLIKIEEVGGVGNLATEYVRLRQPSDDPEFSVSLQGWRIKDQDNHNFEILEKSGLPNLELHGQGAVNIYSKDGTSNAIELYLGLSEPIWSPGETVTLIDPDGNEADTYIIP